MTAVRLPPWAPSLRPHQADAVEEIVDHYTRGARTVVLDAPTGSGKTLIADLVRQRLAVDRSLYVCSDKSLQAQFARDFTDSRIVMGRRNYRPNEIDHIGETELTCDDCTGPQCRYCTSRMECPYMDARFEANRAPVGVLNTAYYLAEINGPGRFKGREFTVFDECDTIEDYLRGWSRVVISRGRLRQLGLHPPTKRSHWTTLVKWFTDEFLPTVDDRIDDLDVNVPDQKKEREGWSRLRGSVTSFLQSYCRNGEPWVKEVDAEVVLRPVLVGGFGARGIWQHTATDTAKYLLMSATPIGPRAMLEEIGHRGAFEVVTVPMTFPAENRPIYNLPLARVTAKADEAELDRLCGGVAGVLRRHPRESVLVHAVSYKLTQRIVKALETSGRTVHFYLRSQDREAAVEAFSHDPGSVLVAPSLERGVDFHGDLCRVQVIAKVPYPNMGDKQVSERLRADGGQLWFDVQTVRTLVQMTGRGVRSASDTAVTYILDSMFTTLLRAHPDMFPTWWSETITTPFQPVDLLN